MLTSKRINCFCNSNLRTLFFFRLSLIIVHNYLVLSFLFVTYFLMFLNINIKSYLTKIRIQFIPTFSNIQNIVQHLQFQLKRAKKTENS